MILKDALDGYWLARRREFSANTVRDYQHTFARFQAFLGPIEITDITPKHIHKYLNHIKAKHRLADKTLANNWMALSSLFTWAAVEFEIEHPMRDKKVPCPTWRRPEIIPYSETEIRALIHATERAAGWDTAAGRRTTAQRPTVLRDKTIVVLLVDTGLRASELCDLKIADYQAADGRILVRHGKGDKQRVVYAGQAARRLLWKYLATRTDAPTTAPLFCTRFATPLDRTDLNHLIGRLAKRAGVAKANVHRFRHTFAINLLRNGANLLELQRLLGHEQMNTITIYVKLAHSDLADTMRSASPADRWGL